MNTFVDGRKFKATQGLWELLTKSNPDKNTVTIQDRQAYKEILCNCLLTETKSLGNRYNNNVSG